jgi:hypothetical protein
MIKRLTDEPTKLAVSRPDLSFPAGLQPVLDTALTRNPVERYQTVAKFAADVASVTGVGRAASAGIPQTRAPATDTEGKTQLLDTSAGGGLTQRLSAKRTPAGAATAKKRSMVPVAVGVVVVLAAGGAWMVMSGGPKTNGVSPDTAGVVTNPQTADSGRKATGTPAGRNRDSTTPTPPRPRPAGVDPARAGDSLNTLFENIDDLSGGTLRDAALDIFNAPGVSNKDKAMAAYLVANGFSKLSDQGKTCEWAQRAVALERTSRSYNALQQSTCGS